MHKGMEPSKVMEQPEIRLLYRNIKTFHKKSIFGERFWVAGLYHFPCSGFFKIFFSASNIL